MAETSSFYKGPTEKADYVRDWTAKLAGDTIATSDWAIVEDLTGDDDPLTIDSDTHTATTATVWLSSGTPGTVRVTNHITTTGGREWDKTLRIPIGVK